MEERRFSYEQDEVRSQVDEIYSSHDVQEQMRAISINARQRMPRTKKRIIRVETIMNDLVAELFGEQGKDNYRRDYMSQSQLLHHDTAAENQLPVVEDS